jgi:hypothetical protein
VKYIILKKAKPYTRVRRGKLERVRGYTGKVVGPKDPTIKMPKRGNETN